MLDIPQITIEDIDCPTLRSEMKNLIEDLTQLCPSDASVRATFRKIQNKFLGEIRVASETVVMQAMDHADAFSDVIEHVRSQLLSQIVDWRNHRFAV
jgi:hypothetical protein